MLNSFKISLKTNYCILLIKEKKNKFLMKNENFKIHFYWIPVHLGIQGNKIADQLAKNATKETPNPFQVPFTDFKANLKKIAYEASEKNCKDQSATKGKQFFAEYHNIYSHPWFYKSKLSREEIVIINRCRSGHYSLNFSLNKIKLANSSSCECGWPMQDLNHIVWQCPLYDSQRNQLLKNLQIIKQYLPLNVETFLAKPNE